MTSLAVGTSITAEQPIGVVRVLARVVSPGFAECAAERCPVHIQRTSSGDLADGVRAHYRTVHPERGVQ